MSKFRKIIINSITIFVALLVTGVIFYDSTSLIINILAITLAVFALWISLAGLVHIVRSVMSRQIDSLFFMILVIWIGVVGLLVVSIDQQFNPRDPLDQPYYFQDVIGGLIIKK